MSKKNIIILVIAVVVIVAIAIILGKVNKKESTTNTNVATNENTDNNTSAKTTNGKVLVVYYSAQNHTKKVAQRIAQNLNADIFEIEPEEKYTTQDLNWNDDNSRVSREHEDTALRDVKLKTTTVENWDSYDTVILGYPIWWGVAAWPTDTFVKENDFTGKTVIPFCTSYSSGIGSSATNLKNEAKGGDWQQGHRFSQNATESDVDNWTNSLDI